MPKYFEIRAGHRARQLIRDQGFHPEQVQVVAGAAGGPKWLVLYALDRFLFGKWLPNRFDPLYLIGSSIGAWRFAAASVADPVAAFDILKTAYINQCYEDRPSPQEVSREGRNIMAQFLDEKRIRQILDHPFYRLNIVAARSGWSVFQNPSRLIQAVALGGAAGLNALSRSTLKLFFDRVFFHHPADEGFFADLADFPVRRVPLSGDNFTEAVLAAGSIPLVMSGLHDISGAPPGVYMDGGIIDYHMNLPYPCEKDRLVLFPHYTNRIIPGWFDKKLFWRKPRPAYLEQVVLICPSQAFLNRLDYGKIPDRKDFLRFQKNDAERLRYWNQVADESRLLADEFQELLTAGKMAEQIKPLSA